MATIIVCQILAISIVTDLQKRKILNIVTIPSIFMAMLYYLINDGLEGFFVSGQGFLVGFGLLLIPFLLGGFGAGDVKLLAAVGAWKGAAFAFYTGIFAAIIGGVIAVVMLISKKKLSFTLIQMLLSTMLLRSTKGSMDVNTNEQPDISIPFAVPIAVGALICFVMESNL